MALSEPKFPSRTGVFLTLLFVTLITEVLVMDFVLPIFTNIRPLTAIVIDASLLTCVLAIALWWLMIKPLHNMALREHVRHDQIRSQVVDAIVTLDMNANIISCNHAAEEIFGYAPEEISGKSIGMLFCDDLLSHQNLARLKALEESSRSIHEIVCHARDGRALQMEISVSWLCLDGLEQFLIIMRDTTARKEGEAALRESETRFRQIFNQSEDAIVFFNPRTCGIVDVNCTAESLFGYSRQELLASGLDAPCFAGSSQAIRSFVNEVRQGGMPYLEKIAGRHKDGTELILSIRCKMITLQGTELIYSTFRDVSQRVRMEEEALQMQSRLIQANKMTTLGLMVSGVAHEVNNPNNFIMANAQLLERSWGDALKILREYSRENGDFLLGGLPFSEMEQHLPEMFEGINDGTRRIKAIIDDLKRFARQDSFDARDTVDINQTVNSAVSILHYEILNHTNRFCIDLGENIPPVFGNGQHLVQVVMNLLLNACQALPSPAAGIWVATSYNADEQSVLITVRDEGEGVPAELGRRILDPFFTTKLDSGGTGLGLSISMSIIKEHDGTLVFASTPGKGTTFTVKLPLYSSPAEENA
jgi:PAS domain S-box-containing protein